jgi:LCP family protein required for cell wall assembly
MRPDQDDEDDVYTVDLRGQRRRRGRAPQPAAYRSAEAPVPGGRRRRSGPRSALRLLGLLLVLWLAFMVLTPLHAWTQVSRADTTPAGERPEPGRGHNYLLVGSDSREGLTPEQRRSLGTGSAEGKRTDSIILVHVPESGGKSVLVSLPRDSYVPIPGRGSDKINASYAIGGPKLLVATVEQVTGLRLDGYVEIGFGGFASVVDSVGGVRMCVPADMKDAKAHIDLKKGCQTLDGANALGYVRARYSDPRGDLGRADRQRQFLGALMKKALNPSTVLVPTTWWSFTHAAAEGLVVGEDTSLRDSTRVLQALRAVSRDEGLSLVVPIQTDSLQTSAGSAVKWDTERARALFALLRADEPLEAPPAGTDGKPAGG